MSDPTQRFLSVIDERHDADQSVVLRYHAALELLPEPAEDTRLKSLLAQTSIREGLRVFDLCQVAGVQVCMLDETSLMHTGTLKSIDGCVTTAHCLLNGFHRVVFETGGNTGTALAEYGRRAGIESYCVLPEANLPLLSGSTFDGQLTHLVAVEDRARLKEVAQTLACRHGLERIPRTAWRYQASMFTGWFLLGQLLTGPGFDYLVQTVSAGFGPIGIYRVLMEHRPALGVLPRFIGVQQDANCPMYRAWRPASAETLAGRTPEVLSAVMYDRDPHSYGTTSELMRLLDETGGWLTLVSLGEFKRLLGSEEAPWVLDLLHGLGVEIARRDGAIVERTGLIALAGVLKEIAAGRIPAGSRVLCCLTSGAWRPQGRALPEERIRGAAPLEKAALHA
jgi:threonine synthase